MQFDLTEIVQNFVYDTYLKQTASCYSVFDNDPLKVVLLPWMTVIVYKSLLGYFFPRLYTILSWIESFVLTVLYAVVIILIMWVSMVCDARATN